MINSGLIITDLDGTILDDSLRHYRCYVDIINSFGGKCISQQDYWDAKRDGLNRRELLRLSCFRGTYDDYLNSWVNLIETDEYLQFETLKNNALDTLIFLKDNSEKLILATMRQNRENLIRQLKKLNIFDFFDEIITANPLLTTKAEGLMKYYGDIGYFIGDTEADLSAGQAIGFSFIFVEDGIRNANRNIDAFAKVETFSELTKSSLFRR